MTPTTTTEEPNVAGGRSAKASKASLPQADADKLLEVMGSKNFTSAKKLAKSLIKKHPKASLPHSVLAGVAAENGDLEQAAKHFFAAYELEPTDPKPLENIAKILISGGKRAEGVAIMRKLALEFDGHPTAANLLTEAKIRLSLSEIDMARVCILDALDLEPLSVDALTAFARLLLVAPEGNSDPRSMAAMTELLRHEKNFGGYVRFVSRAASFALAANMQAGPANADDKITLSEQGIALLVTLMGVGHVSSHVVERALTGVRKRLLQVVTEDEDGGLLSADDLAISEALALQSFFNEYIWEETPEETALVERLQTRLERRLKEGGRIPGAEIYLLGAYRRLAKVQPVRIWAAMVAVQNPNALDPTLRTLILEPVQEELIGQALPNLTEIEDGVSSKVREQYEENPYPRWRTTPVGRPIPYVNFIRASVSPNNAPDLKPTSKTPNVLIAGCGTGQHPISVSRRYANARILAIDLSRASLSYAARKAMEMEIGNISFAQADILRLPEIEERFDVVEASGVIHHMKDPEEGLRALLAVLKPGGYLKLGLYSQLARRFVNHARHHVAESGYPATLEGIRSYRRDCFDGKVKGFERMITEPEFYTTSTLRDLVFHVQEHQYTVPGIAKMLASNGLEFLGFCGLREGTRSSYSTFAPDDPNHIDLESWSRYEQREPWTFAGMYQFWAQKKG